MPLLGRRANWAASPRYLPAGRRDRADWAKRAPNVSAKRPEVGHGWRPPAAPASAVHQALVRQSRPPGSGPACPQRSPPAGIREVERLRRESLGQGQRAGAIARGGKPETPQAPFDTAEERPPPAIGVVIAMADVAAHLAATQPKSALTKTGAVPGKDQLRIAVGVLIAASLAKAAFVPARKPAKVPPTVSDAMAALLKPKIALPLSGRGALVRLNRLPAAPRPKPPRSAPRIWRRSSRPTGFPCRKTGCPSWPSW